MRTVFAGLPFYDSLDKTDRVRTASRLPFSCPRHQLLPFQINVGTDNPGEIQRVDLLDCKNVATDITSYFNGGTLITSWTNAGYDTFTTAGDDISALVKTTAGDADYGYSNLFPVVSGELIRIIYSGTITSGTAPKIVLVNNAGVDISNIATLAAGVNYIILRATATATEARVRVRNAITEVFNGALTIASSNKTSLPVLYTALSNDYFQYKGQQLFTPLPRGQWKIKLTTVNGYVYYSENIAVSDIYANQISGWTNSMADPYGTLTAAGTSITSAITAAGPSYVGSNSFEIRKGEAVSLKTNVVPVSGQLPSAFLLEVGGGLISPSTPLAAGVNNISLVATKATTAAVYLWNNAAANWAAGEAFIHRTYSPRFIRLDLSNAKDLGGILYQDGWAQTLFLETKMNYPTTETVEVGDEKDGVFNPEKIVTKYIYRISTYINRAMHAVLTRISQHSSVVVTDEVGNTYTPAVGNIRMEADQPHFETTHAVISFNDGDNSAYDWTYDMSNMT
jgi:hypothetical protein